MLPRALAFAPLAGVLAACGGAMPAPSGAHDVPVAAAEPRAELRLVVDLEARQGCEEAFDLAFYEDRAIDLVAWDARAGSCSGRAVTIRYLPRRRAEADVLARVRALATRVAPLPATPTPERP
jgi:hypothetical protein